jgi:hypothetical protein
MAIKTKNSRDTYRSNVKKRPLQQNGLEAQYQGLDISEVNKDHGGLAIIGRGGLQTRRDIRKVRKQYIIDVDQEEHYPRAEIVFKLADGTPDISRTAWSSSNNLQGLVGETLAITDQTGVTNTFEFSADASVVNGGTLSSSNKSIRIVNNKFSATDLLSAITGSIEAVFPKETFSFSLFPSGSTQTVDGIESTIVEDKLELVLSSSALGSAAINSSSGYLDVTSNMFANQSESHRWRLNGVHQDDSNGRQFFEDLRTDTIQSTTMHSLKSTIDLFRAAQYESTSSKSNYDANIDSIAGDPKLLSRFATHDSTEVIIRQYPKREELFGTFSDNFTWREDVHFLSADQQTWTNMSLYATMYHSDLESHITAMLDSNFADEQYIDRNPMSGRVDVFKRLSRIFDTHVELIFERHPYSVFDQFLDPLDDFINLQENRFPKRDDINSDRAFEDIQGTRQGDKCIWEDYFDQPLLENHDYVEDERWTRIDDDMLTFLTVTEYNDDGDSSTPMVSTGRSTHIDRREWQESDYVYTSTGFINSQNAGQDGIIYREMKR